MNNFLEKAAPAVAGLQIEHRTDLDPTRRQAILSRSQVDVSEVLAIVAPILAACAPRRATPNPCGSIGSSRPISPWPTWRPPRRRSRRLTGLDPRGLAALKVAAGNIEKFHQAQREREMWAVEAQPGILAGRLTRPLDRVGCYIPGGLASYPSSALMNIIPAKVAGVKEIFAATPPGPEMAVNPATLVAAHLAGAQRLLRSAAPGPSAPWPTAPNWCPR